MVIRLPCAMHIQKCEIFKIVSITECYISLSSPCVVAQLVQGLATGLTDRGSNTNTRETFRSRPDRPWCPPRLLTMGTGTYPEVNRPRRGVNYLTSFSVEVKKRIELHGIPLLLVLAFVVCYIYITFTLHLL
jgi:hypothetical protein